MTSQHSVELNSRALGTGHPVVALHGSASSGAAWRSLVGYLEGRFRVHTPDLPGYGASPPGAGGLAGDARAVAGLIERIGAPVHLVGYSWGGAVALKLAAWRPEAVRSLTVIEPSAFHLLRGGSDADRRLFEEVMAIGAAMDPAAGPARRAAAMRLFIDYWNGDGAWARTSPRLRDFFLRCHDRIRAEFRAVACEAGGLGDLGRIACPTLAVMGLEFADAESAGDRARRPGGAGGGAQDRSRRGAHAAADRPARGRPDDRPAPGRGPAGGARLSVGRGVKGVDGWAGTVRGRPRAGQSAERRRVTRAEDIAAFTAMTGDRNPLHYDGELAAASVFGRIIVQGGVTSGLLNALVAEDLPGPGTVFLAVEWKFRKAVGIGEELTARAEVLTVREDKPICTLATSIRDGAGDVCLEGSATTYTVALSPPGG